MTNTNILTEVQLERALRDYSEGADLAACHIPALIATVKALRERYESLKSTIAWHRDGVGPDVPVLQERYDKLIAQGNNLQSQLAALREENERLKNDACWHCGTVLEALAKPRCEDCPDECDVVNCDAYGCADRLADQHLDSWK